MKTMAGFINYKVFTCIYGKNYRWFYQLQGIYMYLSSLYVLSKMLE